MPAWEPDLAGGGLPRGSPATASPNATHTAWLGLREGQHGWEEILTPDHLPDTKEMCSCPPCRQKCFSYAQVAMCSRPWPLPPWCLGTPFRPIAEKAVGHSSQCHPWHEHSDIQWSCSVLASCGPCTLCGVPVFQGSLVSLGTEIAQPVSALVTPCHKPCQRPVPTLLTGCCRLVFTVRASPASLGLLEAAEFFALILLSP